MKSQGFIAVCVATAVIFTSCNNGEKAAAPESKTPAIKEENITYTGDGVTMKGYVAYDSSNMDKRPVVLVIHEWWGLVDYVKSRVRQLAELGYLAMAVDLYGDGKTADNP